MRYNNRREGKYPLAPFCIFGPDGADFNTVKR